MANPAARKMGSWEGFTCYQLTHKSEKPCEGGEHFCPLEDVKRKKEPVVVEHIHLQEDDEKRFFEVHGYPIFDKRGNVIQMIEYSVDITKRKKAQEVLRKANRELRTLDELKNNIISNVSHELKTPLAIIKASIEFSMDEDLEEERNEILSLALKSVNRQNDIIEDLIAVSRINLTKKDIIKELVNLNELILMAIDDLKEKADKSEVRIIFNPKSQIPLITGNYGGLRRAVRNLLDNGIKFNKKGGEVRVHLNHDDIENSLTISIKDTGIGIRPKDQEKIFDKLTHLIPPLQGSLKVLGWAWQW